MYCKKIIITCIKLGVLLLHITAVSANDVPDMVAVSNEVHQLLKVYPEALDNNRVEVLLKKVQANRHYYSNEVIAKTLLLAARVASNQGDINNVHSLAKEGLSVHSLDKAIMLSLNLKLAEVYVATKEYHKLLAITESLVKESDELVNVKYNLLSLSYRSVAYSMLGQHYQALDDLQSVGQRINQSELHERIPLLTVFALSYYHLSDYQTSLIMQLKIQKLRFELQQLNNIDQTYLYLGYSYFYLQRFDDAYNAFWESKAAAVLKGAPINIAHANKGLGIVLLTQNKSAEALEHLQQAVNTFSNENMVDDAIEANTALAKVMLNLGQSENAYTVLSNIIVELKGKDISLEFSGFNRMVADMYFDQKEYELAYQWRMKDSDVLLQKLDNKKKSFTLLNDLSRYTSIDSSKIDVTEQSKNIAVNLAESSQLSSRFVAKYEKQRFKIISLAIALLVSLFIIAVILLRARVNKINSPYDEIDKPSYILSAPIQTKHHYQWVFNKARQYQYPLYVGYLVITNWQELTFHFNDKAIKEITKDIASVINQHIGVFDHAGLLNHGEYLLTFEHQNEEEVAEKITKLVKAINTRSFANLGSMNIVMNFSINSPNFKDIDPYLFLARISESVSIDHVNH